MRRVIPSRAAATVVGPRRYEPMLRLVLLLLGTPVARRGRFVLLAAALVLLGLGGTLMVDTLDGVYHFPLHLFGWVMLALGLAGLSSSSMSSGVQQRLRQIRAVALVLLAYLVIDGHPKRNALVITVVFGLAYALDGILRVASAAIVRFPAWPRAMLIGLGEIVFAAIIFEPRPVRHDAIIELCIGLGLALAGVYFARVALALGRAPSDATLPLLLSGRPRVAATATNDVPTLGTVTVHVWTPTGSIKNAQHQPLVDRYIAARDENGVISTGHAALEGPDGLYISHYPAVEMDRTPEDLARTLRATVENDVPAKFQPSYAEEAAGWCESNEKIRFDDVDVAKLRRFWAAYSAENVYNLTRRNCSSTTAVSLEIALEGWLSRQDAPIGLLVRAFMSPELWAAAQLRARAESMAWTPGLVLDYARALSGALHPPEDSWSAKVAKALATARAAAMRERDALAAHEAKTLSVAAAPPSGRTAAVKRTWSIAAVVTAAAIFGLTYGLLAPLVAADLAAKGHTEIFIGLNAAMHAVGVLGVAPLLPRLSIRFGARRLMLLALAASAAILALFPFAPSIWLWFPLRLGLGVAAEILFVMSETWANELAGEESRGKVMAIYTAAQSLGFAGGPLLLSVVTNHRLAYLAGAAIAALAILPLASRGLVEAERGEESSGHALHYARMAPLATGTAVLNAAVETAGLSFVALYAVGLGFTEANALRLVSTLLIGAIVLQLPIGILADKIEKRRLLVVFAVLAAASAFAWPWMLRSEALAFGTVFVWGGLFVGIYTVMLTMVGGRFRGPELVGVYSVMSVGWGMGALVGPALVGMAMTASPRLGLPWAIAAACVFFAAAAARFGRRGV